MEFFANELYHIYNRGNNRRKIFFVPDNYQYFLKKVTKYVLPYCELIAYCLMPNHFHFLIYSDERTIANTSIGGKNKNVLSEGIKTLLSSYAQAINKRNGSTGSLFQQNTKAKPIVQGDKNYDLTCFHYIHQNPIEARLVTKMEDWPYSSFRDYMGLSFETICSKELGFELLGLNKISLYEDSYEAIGIDQINKVAGTRSSTIRQIL